MPLWIEAKIMCPESAKTNSPVLQVPDKMYCTNAGLPSKPPQVAKWNYKQAIVLCLADLWFFESHIYTYTLCCWWFIEFMKFLYPAGLADEFSTDNLTVIISKQTVKGYSAKSITNFHNKIKLFDMNYVATETSNHRI
ncbi:unnamed protein product [Bubo scandiacus]